MSLLHALVLGITQGLAEFLPISSSGHLRLVPWFFGWDDFSGRPELELAFDVSLHIGTLAGAIAYFRRDLVRLARGGVLALRARRGGALANAPASGSGTEGTTETSAAPAGSAGSAAGTALDPLDDGRLAWLLLASAVPAAVTGALLSDAVARLGKVEWTIGVLLVVFGLVLLWADRLGGTRGAETFGLRAAVAMGTAQALALAPGVSRSGATITTGRWLGFSRDAAARLSFLMSLPITGGAVLYEMVGLIGDGGLPEGFVAAMGVGIAASAATGWLAVWGTLHLVRTMPFRPFVVYRVVAGVGVILLAATGLR
ncbi:undecaprenyl-diphosphate phosphatase [soil metagenome]